MKKNYFLSMLALTALTVGFASCNNDDEANGTAGKSATLTISVKAPDSRATSTTAPSASDDATISNYTVFVFNDLGVLENRVNGTAATMQITGVTTKAKDVYVIANASNLATAIPATVNSKSRLEAWVGDLNGDASQLTNRWAAGKNDAALTFNASNEATATATLKFISARITLKIEPMADYTLTPTDNRSLKLKSVAILNAGGATKLFSTSLIPSAAERTAASFAGKPYYAGITMPTPDMANVPTDYTVASFLKDDISTVDKADFTGKYFYHYSFENAASAPTMYPTIVVIEGEYDGKAIYYPVHLASYQTFDTGTTGSISSNGVERGNSYDITIKLTGKAKFEDGGTYPGETGGDDDPTDDPAEDGKINISISINNWIPQLLVKEF